MVIIFIFSGQCWT